MHLWSVGRESRSSSWCSAMQGIYAWLTGGSNCLIYICIVLDLAVGVVVCNASMLNWLGSPSAFYIYVILLDLAVGGSGMEGICAQLKGESIWVLYICILLDLAMGVVVCKVSMLDWWVIHLSSINMHCNSSNCRCDGIQVICAQLTGWSIYLLYKSIVIYI